MTKCFGKQLVASLRTSGVICLHLNVRPAALWSLDELYLVAVGVGMLYEVGDTHLVIWWDVCRTASSCLWAIWWLTLGSHCKAKWLLVSTDYGVGHWLYGRRM